MNGATGASSWHLTPRERASLVRAVLQGVAAFAGPVGPLVVLAGEYLYDRRDLMFASDSSPIQAMNLQGEALQLRGTRPSIDTSWLIAQGSPNRDVISLRTELAGSAREAGLRQGDPVSVVLASRSFNTTRSGLIVPTRVGDRVDLVVPRDDYSVTALGGSRRSLFTQRDPFTAVGGSSILTGEARQIDLPLRFRGEAPTSPVLPPWRCIWCKTPVFSLELHVLTCPQRPPTFRCENCGNIFLTREALQIHLRARHRWTSLVGRPAGQTLWARTLKDLRAKYPKLPWVEDPSQSRHPTPAGQKLWAPGLEVQVKYPWVEGPSRSGHPAPAKVAPAKPASPAPAKVAPAKPASQAPKPSKLPYDPSDSRCSARTSKGGRCTLQVQSNGLCYVHELRALTGYRVIRHASGKKIAQRPIPATFFPGDARCVARVRAGYRCWNAASRYGLCNLHRDMIGRGTKLVWDETGAEIRLA
jgi:hypothetical protein